MKNILALRFLALAYVMLFASAVWAAPGLTDQQQQAKAIFLNFEKLSAQTSTVPFQKWFETMANFTALDCMASGFGVKISALEASLVATGLPAPAVKSFLNRKIDSTGVYSSASNRERAQLCPAIAKTGFKPFCSPGTVVGDASLKRRHNYPTDYIVLKAGQSAPLNLQLRCSVAVLETKSDGGTSYVSWPIQSYLVRPADVVKLESAAIAKWSGASDQLVATAVNVPAGYRSPAPLNLVSGPIHDVMIGNLTVKMRTPEPIATWLVVVEP